MSNSLLDREELREFFAEELELPLATITDEAEFTTDLGVDSLITMELMVQLEKRYKIKLAEEEIATLHCLDSVFALLSVKLQGA